MGGGDGRVSSERPGGSETRGLRRSVPSFASSYPPAGLLVNMITLRYRLSEVFSCSEDFKVLSQLDFCQQVSDLEKDEI